MILTTDKINALEITKRIGNQLHRSITSAKAAFAAGGCSVWVITSAMPLIRQTGLL